ncbi:hypothetical protein [Methanogenium sp. MK-MG]|uniref:hypothetical protein n=1 Tax=Methanogenium sp. MK-MG TaxID=2599926 RepID=UPI0013EBB9CF|nr:hypothetical protein [Methanogenium sp. MK-MG]KAF1078835.1 hypothetical protein MKMG_00254 [Methanogenium sp. MK-MG]
MGKRSRQGRIGIFVVLVASFFGAPNYTGDIWQFVPSGTGDQDDEYTRTTGVFRYGERFGVRCIVAPG